MNAPDRMTLGQWCASIAECITYHLVAVLSGIIMGPPTFFFERRFKIRMQLAGRFLAMRDARQRIWESGGTLIIEAPSLGLRMTRAWWTPDDVAAESPNPEPTEKDYDAQPEDQLCLPWDQWCWDHYIGYTTGRAHLLRAWNGMVLEHRLTKRYSNLNVVHTCSYWPRYLERNPEARGETP